VRLVNGRGEAVKSGGRVMKNVTGLDLVKLVAGSWGTLGFLTEVTFKVLPVPERVATLVLPGLDAPARPRRCPRGSARRSSQRARPICPAGFGHPEARTLLRLEGFEASIAYRLGELRRLLRPFGPAEVLEDEAASLLWRAVRDIVPLADPRADAVWRISTAPTKGPAVAAAIARTRPARSFFDWGGGLVWLSTDAAGDPAPRRFGPCARGRRPRDPGARAGGGARAVDVFEPQARRRDD
jgi:glycolate oxidase FAD binding subunit